MCAQSDEWAIDAYAWASKYAAIQMTPIEVALWDDIRAENAVMYPQIPVGPFFVDFGNPAAKVAIECDGREWHLDKAKDAARDRAMSAFGWVVYRITGSECFTDDVESLDEDGNTVVTLSIARKFVIRICDAHSLRRVGHTRDPIHISEAIKRAFMRYEARAA